MIKYAFLPCTVTLRCKIQSSTNTVIFIVILLWCNSLRHNFKILLCYVRASTWELTDWRNRPISVANGRGAAQHCSGILRGARQLLSQCSSVLLSSECFFSWLYPWAYRALDRRWCAPPSTVVVGCEKGRGKGLTRLIIMIITEKNLKKYVIREMNGTNNHKRRGSDLSSKRSAQNRAQGPQKVVSTNGEPRYTRKNTSMHQNQWF